MNFVLQAQNVYILFNHVEANCQIASVAEREREYSDTGGFERLHATVCMLSARTDYTTDYIDSTSLLSQKLAISKENRKCVKHLLDIVIIFLFFNPLMFDYHLSIT